MNKYKFDAIFWDIDDTLLDFESEENYSFKKCFSMFGLGEASEDLVESYKQINKKYWSFLSLGEMTKEEILVERFNEFFKKYNMHVDSKAFNYAYSTNLGIKIKFNDNSYAILKDLKNKIKQYALTDGTMLHKKNQLKNAKLYEVLDGIFISEEVGSCKPNKDFFDYVLNSIPKFDLDRILIVGDGLKTDILGGNNAGIKTCYYNPRHKKVNENVKIDYQIDSLNKIYDILNGN